MVPTAVYTVVQPTAVRGDTTLVSVMAGNSVYQATRNLPPTVQYVYLLKAAVSQPYHTPIVKC